MKERILILGGANSQIPLIKYAKDRGLYVITADYLPLNPGHKYAHEYHNVNTVDKDAILRLAMECKIDAISSYASDPGAPSAAFVAEQMNLVGSPYRTVEILSNKYLFRQFLREKGYPTPWFISGVKKREFQSLDFSQAAVLKPVDSSGSKGIFRVVNKNDFDNYFKRSMAYSRGGRVILEEFIDKKGPQIHGEGFVLNGEVIFLLLGDQYFSKVNNMAPFSTIVPSLFHNDIMSRVHEEVKSLIKDVGYMTGGINVEAIRDQEDRIFILEIGARNGGNFMPQLIRHTTGFDLVRANVDALIDRSVEHNPQKSPKSHFAQIILHSDRDGYFHCIRIPDTLENNIVETHLFFQPGKKIRKYKTSRDVVGVLIVELKNDEDLEAYFNLSETNECILLS